MLFHEQNTKAEQDFVPMLDQRKNFADRNLFGSTEEEETKVEVAFVEDAGDGMEVDEVTSSSEEIKEMEGDFLKCEETIRMKKKEKMEVDDPEEISAQTLQDIADSNDCYIGDPELLNSKKALTSKHTPMAIVAQLISKLPVLRNIKISQSDIQGSIDPETRRSIFHLKVGFLEINVVGEASDFSKQKVKQVASQRFLQHIFPDN